MAEDGYLLFVAVPNGYELREREGEPPAVGDELEEDELRLRVAKIAPSPLPGDRRRCVYLQRVS
jgi:hypothetical protein